MLDEKQIETLRRQYAMIKKVDTKSPSYKKIIVLLKDSTDDELQQFAESEINWLSRKAQRILVYERGLDCKVS